MGLRTCASQTTAAQPRLQVCDCDRDCDCTPTPTQPTRIASIAKKTAGSGASDVPVLRAAGLIVALSAPLGCAAYMSAVDDGPRRWVCETTCLDIVGLLGGLVEGATGQTRPKGAAASDQGMRCRRLRGGMHGRAARAAATCRDSCCCWVVQAVVRAVVQTRNNGFRACGWRKSSLRGLLLLLLLLVGAAGCAGCCDSSAAGCDSCCSRKRGCRMKSKSKK